MTQNHHGFIHNLDKSAIFTFIGIVLLFSAAVAVVLIAPGYVDPTWTSPTSAYQVQMYEVSDPHLYIGTSRTGARDLQFVYHIKRDYSLLAFKESETIRILAPPELQKYVTKIDDKELKLTSDLLMVRKAEKNPQAQKLQDELQQAWEQKNPQWKEQSLPRPKYEVMEIYPYEGNEAFALAPVDSMIENWVDENFLILGDGPKQPYHKDPGVIYINNPIEYRVSPYSFAGEKGWKYDPKGQPIKNLDELQTHELGFKSRQELIHLGEHQFSIEGCWYCHTDQTRTLVQDTVLNGSAEYPAPPSSANEYIYQKITFPGTRRIGPDLSRTGVKRPSRDWHKGHFWSPKTASKGSIMPSFRHFFDNDPRGIGKAVPGIPNHQFEAIYQYLMTKGTRITPPTEAWWLGKDPVNTKAIIEGRKTAQ